MEEEIENNQEEDLLGATEEGEAIGIGDPISEEVLDEEILLNESVEVHLPSGFVLKLNSKIYTVFDLSNLMLTIHKHFNSMNGKQKIPPYV